MEKQELLQTISQLEKYKKWEKYGNPTVENYIRDVGRLVGCLEKLNQERESTMNNEAEKTENSNTAMISTRKQDLLLAGFRIWIQKQKTSTKASIEKILDAIPWMFLTNGLVSAIVFVNNGNAQLVYRHLATAFWSFNVFMTIANEVETPGSFHYQHFIYGESKYSGFRFLLGSVLAVYLVPWFLSTQLSTEFLLHSPGLILAAMLLHLFYRFLGYVFIVGGNPFSLLNKSIK